MLGDEFDTVTPSRHGALANDNAGKAGPRRIPVQRGYRKLPPSEEVVVLDIETIVDRELLPKDWPEDRFPKPLWHQVVAISVVTARIERDEYGGPETFTLMDCKSGGEADWSEATLLRSFWRFFDDTVPRLVTFNGRSFDLAVLKARAMIYGIPTAAWFQCGDKWSSYPARFNADWHIDLMDVLCDYGSSTRMALDDLTTAIGLPGKMGEHGSLVADMVAAGEIDRVRNYCELDVLNTFAGYLRFCLATGRSTPETYNASIGSMVEYLESQSHREHLAAFLAAWRDSNRPAPMLVRDSIRAS